MKNVNCIALSAPDTASADGSQIDANQLVSASFAIIFGDATAAGTVKVQASNDICNDRYQANAFTVTNWVDIPTQTATITTGTSALLTIANMSYRWIRVVYTRTSGGSSTIVVNMNALSV